MKVAAMAIAAKAIFEYANYGRRWNNKYEKTRKENRFIAVQYVSYHRYSPRRNGTSGLSG